MTTRERLIQKIQQIPEEIVEELLDSPGRGLAVLIGVNLT
jgi:hypothetical protein